MHSARCLLTALLLMGSPLHAQSVSHGGSEAAGPSSTDENAPTAPAAGWDGALPEAADLDDSYESFGGSGDVLIFIDNSIRIGGVYRDGVVGYGRNPQQVPCGPRNAPRFGQSQRAGYLSGGTFGSTVRCGDGYPGLPLRHWQYDAPHPHR